MTAHRASPEPAAPAQKLPGANGANHGPAVEVYLGPGRYFTVTGKQWPQTPDEVTLLDRAALLRLAELVPKPKAAVNGSVNAAGADSSRSAIAFRKGAELRRAGLSFDEMAAHLRSDPETAEWVREKGDASGGREIKRIWQKAAPDKPAKARNVLALVRRLENTSAWQGAIRLNDLTAAFEVREPFPPTDTAPGLFRPLREQMDVLEAMLWFQANGCPTANKHAVFDTMAIVAHRNPHHPIRRYLDGLVWDGVARVSRLFQHYFNAEMPDDDDGELDRHVAYLEHISRCFLVSAVARVMEPGCKVDHLPVIVGMQGGHKSKAIQALCPNLAWFTDDLSPNLIERDTKESLLGKWLVELAEIPHVRKEAERVKAFFSRQTDRYRRAYDRSTADWPRQCVFIGSSNDLEFVDPTGNRRFWPFHIGRGTIDVAAIVADRDQLWAEAAGLYRDGCEWWLPPKLELIAAERQAGYVEEDIWDELLETWWQRPQNHDRPFTLGEAMIGALENIAVAAEIPKQDQMRAAGCLKRLGFRKGQLKRGAAGRAHYWTRAT